MIDVHAYPMHTICANCGDTWGHHYGDRCPVSAASIAASSDVAGGSVGHFIPVYEPVPNPIPVCEVVGEFILDCGEYWMDDHYGHRGGLGGWYTVAGSFHLADEPRALAPVPDPAPAAQPVPAPPLPVYEFPLSPELKELIADPVPTYKVERHSFNAPKTLVMSGVTLEEAKAWCSRDDTHGDGWFDAWTAE